MKGSYKNTTHFGRINNISRRVLYFFSTTLFFRIVIGISVVQGIWYAVSFRPHIFDEPVHIGFIRMYADKINPFLSQQSMSWDFLGEVTRDASYLYYYLMSYSLRIFSIFTDSEFLQILFLRGIHVALFAGGLVLYRKAFLEAGLPKMAVHLALLLLVLTPSIAPLSGSVNYDSVIFVLAGLLLFMAIRVVKSERINFQHLALIGIIGLLSSLMKFEFIAVFVPVALYLCFDIWHKHKRQALPRLKQSLRTLRRSSKVALVAGLVFSFGLFIERPVMNFVMYGRITPRCTQIKSEERCAENYTAQRSITALAAKPDNFSPMNPFNYLLQEWIPGMVTTQTILPPTQHSSPLLRLLYFTAALGGALLLIYYLRDFTKQPAYRLLLFVTAFYTLMLALYNYQAYVGLGRPVAITGRYLLLVMPIFILFVGLSVAKLLRQNSVLLATGLIGVLLIFSQGGGVLTFLMSAPSTMYWRDSVTSETNTYLKHKLHGLVRLSNVP